MYNLGLLRGRLVPSQTNLSKGAIGWRLLVNDEHIHTPLGYLEWLLAPKPNMAEADTIITARLALDAVLAVQCYTEFANGVRLSYVSLLEWLKGKFPHPTEVSRVAWLRVLSAAMFSTTSQDEIGTALLEDFIADAEHPRLLLLWREQPHLFLRREALGELITEGLSLFDVKPNKTFLYWIGKEPEARGIYSLAERGAADFLASFAAVEAQAIRENNPVHEQLFLPFFYKNPTQHTPDILGLLPALAEVPSLTQPTHQLMKTLREGAIEAVQQLYGADAATELKPQGKLSAPPLPTTFPHQKIFFGPPGTGKSTQAKKVAAAYQPARTTFHPDTDYGSFVGAYKPVKDEAKGEITYDFRPQVFAQAYWQAWQQHPQPCFLLIEEINRGNCAQIFGDLFQTLDRGATGYSEYAGRADADLAQWLRAQLAGAAPAVREHYAAALAQAGTILPDPAEAGDWVLLPNNIYLYATMNTSDQSLFPMDSAFKRRWAWEYVPIEYNKLAGTVLNLGAAGRYDWVEFLTRVNANIQEFTESEDKQLGPWFVPPRGGEISRAEFCDKVMFYLWSDIYKLDPARENGIFWFQPRANLPKEKFTFADLYGPAADARLRSFMTDTLAVPLAIPPAAVAGEDKPEPEADAPDDDAAGA